MNLAVAVAVGVLFATSLFLLLSSNVQRIAIGFLLLSNAVNLLVLGTGTVPPGSVPAMVVDEPRGPYVDPLPQAFVLTAIVISLGATAWVLSMALGLQVRAGRDTLEEAG